jgi:hypothetical protein
MTDKVQVSGEVPGPAGAPTEASLSRRLPADGVFKLDAIAPRLDRDPDGGGPKSDGRQGN